MASKLIEPVRLLLVTGVLRSPRCHCGDYGFCVRLRPIQFPMLAVAAALLLGSCKSDVDVLVRARPEGSGTIRVTAVLDQEAAQWLGPPEKALAGNDLAKRGWAIRSLTPTDDGGITFGVEHGFATVAEGNELLDDLTGPDGPFAKLQLTRKRSVLSTSVNLVGDVDLTKRLEAFGDDELATLVGQGSRIGVGEADLPLGDSVDKLLTIKLTSDMAGVTKSVPLPLGVATKIVATGKVWTWEVAAGLLGAVAGLIGLIAIRRTKD
jgi:hypothetical protein